jgi:hypothetical protein
LIGRAPALSMRSLTRSPEVTSTGVPRSVNGNERPLSRKMLGWRWVES